MRQTTPIFRGIATALVTPTTPTGIDYDAFARLIRMAVTTDGSDLDDLQTRLWSAALGAVCFSHAAVRPNWAEIYAPRGVTRHAWAEAEVDWMCRLVFARLTYRG